MPKETFFRLPSDKKKRILDAAEKEFCRVPFNEASINKIIKTAEIPRGSFYQYFEDKNDIFLYLLSLKHEEISRVVREDFHKMDGDIFAFYDLYADKFLDFYRSGRYGEILMFLSNEDSIHIFFQMSNGQCMFENMQKETERRMLESINFNRLNVETEEEKRHFVAILDALVKESLHGLLCNQNEVDIEVLCQNFLDRMHFLKKFFSK